MQFPSGHLQISQPCPPCISPYLVNPGGKLAAILRLFRIAGHPFQKLPDTLHLQGGTVKAWKHKSLGDCFCNGLSPDRAGVHVFVQKGLLADCDLLKKIIPRILRKIYTCV